MWYWALLTILATVFCAASLYAVMCCFVRGEDKTAILKERLARGEINEAQYKAQRQLLED